LQRVRPGAVVAPQLVSMDGKALTTADNDKQSAVVTQQ
jgi:hypothetical protein